MFRLTVALLVVALGVEPAAAEERHALVVAVQGDDVLVDAGKPNGLHRGVPVSVFHIVLAKHPVTGKLVRGAFPIGRASVLEAGTGLSLLEVTDEALQARLVVGDEIRFEPGQPPAPVVRRPAAPVPVPVPAPAAGGPSRASAEQLENESRRLLIAGQYAEALAQAAAAVELQPDRPQALQIAGVAACYVGRADLAAQYAGRLGGERQRVVRQVCTRRGTPLANVLASGPLPATGDVRPAAVAVPAGPDPELVEELADTFGQAAGRSAEQATQVWQDYLTRHPDSPFAARVRQEMAQRAADMGAAAPALDVPGRGFHHQPASRIEAGQPLSIVVALGRDENPREVWLHYRSSGAATWQQRSFERSGDGYLRADLPPTEVRAPGVEYFAEARYGDAQVIAVVGSDVSPVEIEVTPTVEVRAAPRAGRSRVSTLVEHVDFNTGGAGPDRYTMVEVDFMYRFMSPVYAMRVGLGTLQGQGGALDSYGGSDHTGACASESACRERSFTYAYTELEFRAQKNLAVAGRIYAGGLSKPSTNNALETREDGFGLMGWVRIGEERGTNLSLGLANVSDFGTTGELKLQWGKVQKLPITGIVQATNLPAGKELGFRGALEVGYQVTRWFYPTVRVGYNARTIRHAGLAGGVALVFDW